MKKIDIGLDIGIASVGWAITDHENLNIIKHGARLFDTLDNKKDSKLENENRREARSARRQNNRRKTLRRDFIKMLIDEKVITNISFDKKGNFVNKFIDLYIKNSDERKGVDSKNSGLGVFYLRKKGMSQKLNLKQTIWVLYWYINHRGFKYTTNNDDKLEEKDLKFKTENGYPVDWQLNYIKENNRLNGTFNRTIKHSEYLKELEIILDNQDLSTAVKEKFIELFNRQRSFEEGPGVDPIKRKFSNLENISVWSRWKDNPHDPYDTIWQKTVGKCSLYSNEVRMPKKSLTAELFNLLNDLNNVKVNGAKLSKEDKEELINISFTVKSNSKSIMKKITELYNLPNEDSIKGYRIDKKGNPLFTPLISFNEINKIIQQGKNGLIIDSKYNKNNIFDLLSEILFTTQTIEEREIKIRGENLGFNDEQIHLITKLSGYSQTHSFSKKAMVQMIDTFFFESINQMEWIYKYKNSEATSLKTQNYLSTDWIEDVIDTPTVKRSLRQTIKVLKAIFKLCKKENYHIENIVVEMARENKNKAARDNERNRQKYFEEFNKQVENIAGKPISRKSGLFMKLWLFEQQDGKDVYTGEQLSKEDVIANPGSYDIDHIIPYSISFDNSRTNKVLTRQQNNQIKLNKTPYQYLSDSDFARMSKLWMKWYLPFKGKGEKSIFNDKNKLDFLMSKLDFNNPENKLGFLQRNLVDTRYTTRKLIEHLNDITKHNEKYSFKVKTINGKMTSYVRRKIETNKTYRLERPSNVPQEQFDEKTNKKIRIWHGHHAEDAYFVTVINKHYGDSKTVEKILSQPGLRYERINTSNKEIVKKTNALITSEFSEFEASIDRAGIELNRKMKDMKFSRMKISKNNIQLFNETLYAGRIIDDKLYQISSINLIESESKELKTFFEKYMDNCLTKDKELLNELKQIYHNYETEKYPFKTATQDKLYIEIKGQKIRKLKYFNSNNEKKKEFIVPIYESKNKISHYQSVNALEWWVYKDTNDKYKVIAINALNAKINSAGFVIKNDILEQQKKSMKISLDQKREFKLKRGTIFQSPSGERFYISGYTDSNSTIEYKNLNYIDKNDKKRNRQPAEVIFGKNKNKIIHVDILG